MTVEPIRKWAIDPKLIVVNMNETMATPQLSVSHNVLAASENLDDKVDG